MGDELQLEFEIGAHIFDEEPLHKIFLNEGWKKNGFLYIMVCKLPPPKLNLKLPEGYKLRQMRCDEDQKIVEVINKAYRHTRMKGSLIENMKKKYSDWSCDLCWLIEKDGEIASVVVSRPRQEFIDRYGIKRGYIGPVGTVPAHTKKGLATYLVYHVLKEYEKMGFEEVSLWVFSSTPNAIEIYKKTGFEIVHTLVNYVKTITNSK